MTTYAKATFDAARYASGESALFNQLVIFLIMMNTSQTDLPSSIV